MSYAHLSLIAFYPCRWSILLVSRIIDLTGTRFGRLTVLERVGINKWKSSTWSCMCDCGKKRVVVSGDLRSGNTTSCGCFFRENTSRNNTRHGIALTKEYNAWHAAKSRCTNPVHPQWKNYGARGITMCDRWIHSVENFVADMGLCPDHRLTLERVNNMRGYEPGNCVWADWKTQGNNRRNNKR